MSQALMNAGRMWIRNPRVILDLGARDCGESLAFARDYPGARVFAFECNPASVEVCQAAAREASNLAVFPLAVHEFTGTTTFFAVSQSPPHGFSPNVGASSLLQASGHMLTEPIHQTPCEVRCTRPDDWAATQGVRHFDVVWMDLQGAELFALRGMGHLLASVRVLHTGVTYKELYRGQVLHDDLNSWLEGHGFLQVYHARAITVPEWFGEAVYVRRDDHPRLSSLLSAGPSRECG